MNTQFVKPILLLTILTTLCLTGTAQERPDPDRLRREAKELMEKARDLKADGNLEQSEKLAREAKELQHKADSFNEKRRVPDAPRPEARPDQRPDRERVRPPRERPDELSRRYDRRPRPLPERFQVELRRYHLKRAIWHLRAAGFGEQADRLEERLRQAAERFRPRRDDDGRELAPPRFRSDRRFDRDQRP